MNDALQPINPNCKANQVCDHHQHKIPDHTNTANHPISSQIVLPLSSRKEKSSNDFWHHKQYNQPTPNKEVERDIVPQSDKCETQRIVKTCTDSRDPGLVRRAAKGDVDVANEPPVVTFVPASPEGHC